MTRFFENELEVIRRKRERELKQEEDDLARSARKGLRHEKFRPAHLKNPFLNRNYVAQLGSVNYTPEVLFKVASKGFGEKGGKYLMGYIMRNLNGDSKDTIPLKDQFFNEIKTVEDRDALMEVEAQSFDSYKFLLDSKEGFDISEVRRQELLTKKDDNINLTKTEKTELETLNRNLLLFNKNMQLHELEERKKKFGLSKGEDERRGEIKRLLSQIGEKRKKGLEKISPKDQYNFKKDFVHVILSHGGDDINPKRAQLSVDNFLSSEFGEKGFRYVYGMHNDTNHLHFHVLIFNKNHISGKNLHFNKEDLFLLRQEFAEHSNRVGLERIATMKRDRPEQIAKLNKSIDRLYGRQTTYQYKMSKGETKSFDAFQYRKESIAQLDKAEKSANYLDRKAGTLDLLANKKRKKMIRDLKKHWLRVTPDNFKRMADLSVEALEKEDTRLVMTLKETLKEPEAKPKKASDKEQKRKKEYINNLRQSHLEKVEEAEKLISKEMRRSKDQQQKLLYKAHLLRLEKVKNVSLKSLEKKMKH